MPSLYGVAFLLRDDSNPILAENPMDCKQRWLRRDPQIIFIRTQESRRERIYGIEDSWPDLNRAQEFPYPLRSVLADSFKSLGLAVCFWIFGSLVQN